MYGTGISQEVGNGGQVCGDVEAVGFTRQNVYKMTYCDENATFESRCKRETFEPVNSYRRALLLVPEEGIMLLFPTHCCDRTMP